VQRGDSVVCLRVRQVRKLAPCARTRVPDQKDASSCLKGAGDDSRAFLDAFP
jgi:hypothetical protein